MINPGFVQSAHMYETHVTATIGVALKYAHDKGIKSVTVTMGYFNAPLASIHCEYDNVVVV